MKKAYSFIVRALIIMGTSLSLTSCMNGIKIEVTGNDQPTFTINKAGWLGGYLECVGEIRIYEGLSDQSPPIWDLGSISTTTCKPIKQLKYGIVPDGYKEMIAPSTILEGRSYLLLASARGGYFGILKFKKEHDRFIVIDHN